MCKLLNLEQILKNIKKSINVVFELSNEMLGFYKNPKKFITNIVPLSKVEIFKKLILYLFCYELIITLLAFVLFEKTKFNIIKILGITLLDFLFLLPGILIIFLALKVSKVLFALRKSIILYVLTMVFVRIFQTVSYTFFLSFENYTWYVIWGIIVYLMLILLHIFPAFFFSDSKKQFLKILLLTIFFSLLISTLYYNVFPSKLGFQKEVESIITTDPIFLEFSNNLSKTKFIETENDLSYLVGFGELEQIIRLKKFQYIDVPELKKEFKIGARLKQSKILDEIKFFNNKDNFTFQTNKTFFNEIYVNYLKELSLLLDEYHELFKIFELEKSIEKINYEIKKLETRKKEFENSVEYKKALNSELIQIEIYDNIIHLGSELIKKLELKNEYHQLKVDIWTSFTQQKVKVYKQNIDIQKKISNYYLKITRLFQIFPFFKL